MCVCILYLQVCVCGVREREIEQGIGSCDNRGYILQDRQSASWGPMGANSVVSVQKPARSRTKKSQWFHSSVKAGETEV